MKRLLSQSLVILISMLNLLLCGFASQAIADEHPVAIDKDNSINGLEDYFELSGINKVLQSVPEQLAEMKQDAIEQYGENSADSLVLERLQMAWDNASIKQQLILSIDKSLTSQQLSALLGWQNSSLAQMIKLKDQKTESDLFSHELLMFMSKLPASMPGTTHKQAINEIIDAKQIVNDMVNLTLSVSRPVMMALAETELAKKEGLTQEVIESQLLELEQLLYDDLSEQIAVMSYFLYKDVPLGQLLAYAEFYQSDLGQLELAILNKVVHQSIALWQSKYEQDVHHHFLSQKSPTQDNLDG